MRCIPRMERHMSTAQQQEHAHARQTRFHCALTPQESAAAQQNTDLRPGAPNFVPCRQGFAQEREGMPAENRMTRVRNLSTPQKTL